jgi:hypothetical protein
MGKYTEHKAYALSHPEVVYHFIELGKDDHTSFAVKGISSISSGVLIKAIVIYILPYELNGFPAMFSLGLANDINVSTVVGLPFLEATHSIIDLTNHCIHCKTFNTIWPFKAREITVNNPSDDNEEDLKLRASNSTSHSETNDNRDLQLFSIIPVLTSWTSCKPLPLNLILLEVRVLENTSNTRLLLKNILKAFISS